MIFIDILESADGLSADIREESRKIRNAMVMTSLCQAETSSC